MAVEQYHAVLKRDKATVAARYCRDRGLDGNQSGRDGRLGVVSWYRQTLDGSFSAVSKLIFVTKYLFFSIFRDLQDLQSFAPLQTK